MVKAIDLFAGPGGWDVACRWLDIDVTGIEFDEAACKTRRAASLNTIEDDVRRYWPGDFPGKDMLIASPPCQTFSMAGKGAGRAALDDVLHGIKLLEAREDVDMEWDDERTALVLEPLRWALSAIDNDQGYTYLAFEQVPTVLPVWEAMAEVLSRAGYNVATGKLSAEQYGVPQTRTRAFLIAEAKCYECLAGDTGYGCACGKVDLPKPTHRKYRKGVPQAEGDPELRPWRSMADALGWGMTERPYPTIACSRTSGGGPDKEKVGGSGARRQIYEELEAGRWLFCPTNERPNATLRSPDEPAPTLAFGHESPRWLRMGTNVKATVRPEGEPAPTLFFGDRVNGVTWEQSGKASVRVTEEEAAILQSFPADHPWQGTKSKKFQQIGNAVPPLLAVAVLGALLEGGV